MVHDRAEGPQAWRNTLSALTPRERDILKAIGSGKSVKQTALALGIAPKTVENTQSRLFRKLGARNRAQAALICHEHGLLDPADTAPDAVVIDLRAGAPGLDELAPAGPVDLNQPNGVSG
jgi:DNA-binding CsgD family transcriptional regulator